jgi:serine/threonine-protein kinase
MEYVDGCSLRQLLRGNPTVRPPAIIAALIAQVLEGLDAVHRVTDEYGNPLNLVHRDVSPDNILVGSDGVARLADFGIAKAEIRKTHTQPGVHKGKFAYMSPEQIVCAPFDRRADVFSAGVVLYNALTGRTLFGANGSAAIVDLVLHAPIPAPSTVGLGPPAWLDAICLRALSRDPSARYPTAMEMAEALRDAANRNARLACSREIAEWVIATVGADLEARREAIRHLMHHRRDTMTVVDRMPVVPPVGTPNDVSRPDSGSFPVARGSHRAQVVYPRISRESRPVAAPPAPRHRRGVIAAVAASIVGIAAIGIGRTPNSAPPVPAGRDRSVPAASAAGTPAVVVLAPLPTVVPDPSIAASGARSRRAAAAPANETDQARRHASRRALERRERRRVTTPRAEAAPEPPPSSFPSFTLPELERDR